MPGTKSNGEAAARLWGIRKNIKSLHRGGRRGRGDKAGMRERLRLANSSTAWAIRRYWTDWRRGRECSSKIRTPP